MKMVGLLHQSPALGQPNTANTAQATPTEWKRQSMTKDRNYGRSETYRVTI